MRQRATAPHKYSGLSLIELLVTMVIGVFLIGGLANVYLSTKSSDGVRAEVSAMEESARVALSSIRQIISHAGYPSMRNLAIDAPFYAEADSIPDPACRGGGNTDLIRINGIIDRKTIDTNRRDQVVVVSIADSPNSTLPGRLVSDLSLIHI